MFYNNTKDRNSHFQIRDNGSKQIKTVTRLTGLGFFLRVTTMCSCFVQQLAGLLQTVSVVVDHVSHSAAESTKMDQQERQPQKIAYGGPQGEVVTFTWDYLS